jgi:hypothetical protein
MSSVSRATGSRRAGKKIVKMILERQKRHFKSRTPQPPRIMSQVEEIYPENALEALEIPVWLQDNERERR